MNSRRHLSRITVRALAAAAVLLAVALPATLPSVASASPADSVSAITFAPNPGTTNSNYFGTGASGSFEITGTFAGDGGHATVTSTAPGLTFSGVTDTTSGPSTIIQGNFASSSSTPAGTYNLSVTDDNGSAWATNAFSVNAAPSITSLTPATIADSASPAPISATVTGTGFVGTPEVTFTSSVNGTTLTDDVSATGATTLSPATTIALTVTPTNAITSDAATLGTYSVTVVNPDGGTATSPAIFSVTGNSIAALSPSALAIPASGSTTSSVTINGSGFESGATASLGTCPGVTFVNGSTVVNADNSVTFQVSVASGTSATQCDVIITNTAPGNGASSIAPAGLGIGEASSMAPILTSSSLTTGVALVAGAPASSIVFTGEGFSPYTAPLAYTTFGATNVHDPDAVISGCVESNGTTLTCDATATTGTTAGAHTALIANGSAVATLANAFSVAGPTITSAAPPSLAAGAPIGTVVVLTGTGFTNTLQGSVGTGPLAGDFEYVNPTTANFVVTTSPTIADANDTLTLSTVDSYGATTYSEPFALSVGALPTISSITYASGTTGVGVGAVAKDITINGTGLVTGATLSGFEAGGVADTHVSATIVSVNNAGTQAVAAVTISAGDTFSVDGYTLTNANAGSVIVPALAPAGLVIDAAPTISAVAPATALAASTNSFVVTGTGFMSGAVATLSANGTCGAVSALTSTSLSVTCTVGAASATPVTLVVTNPDGGSAATTILPAKVTTTEPHTFKIIRDLGVAVPGRTMRMAIIGSGIFGAPKVFANVAGVRVRDISDNGRVLWVLVTTNKSVTRGIHVFTVRLANGVQGRVRYRTIK